MPILSIAAMVAASLCPAPGVTNASLTVSAVQVPMVGGYRAANTEDQRVQAAAAFAAEELGSELREIESAEQQVVAGMNYRLIIWTTSGERYRVLVHLPLRGNMQLGGSEQLEVADIGPATAD